MEISLSLSLTGRLLSSAFSPALLFALAEPGVWYDPSDVANLNWRRNLLTWTEQFDNAVWSKSNATISANNGAAPDSATTADLFYPTATGTSLIFTGSAARPQAISCYAKASGKQWVAIGTNTNTADVAFFNLQTGAVGAVGANMTSAAIQDVGSGWYRVSVVATTAAAGAVGCAFFVTDANSSLSVTASGTSGILIWGAQLELGSVASDYQRITDVNTEVIERFPTATLFTDTAGTTPVTTPGQTVALALDKSKGLVLGSNTASSDLTTWSKASTATTPTATTANFPASGDFIWTTASVAAGRGYEIKAVMSGSGTLSFGIYGDATGFIPASGNITLTTTPTEYTVVRFFRSADVDRRVIIGRIGSASATSVTVASITVREVTGFHATQATAASRPTYGIVPRTGRRNLLLATDDLAAAQWNTASNLTRTVGGGGTSSSGSAYTRLTATAGNTDHYLQGAGFALTAGVSYAISIEVQYVSHRWVGIAVFDGGYRNGATFDLLNGATGTNLGLFSSRTITPLGGNRYRLSAVYTAVSTANAFFGIVMLDADKAFTTTTVSNLTATTVDAGRVQIETGTTATAYQRVGSAFDVTEAGVASLSYLSFDGVDDFLVTPTITPGTDKAQVFAGVRKLSASTFQCIAEYGIDSASTNGTMGLWANWDNAGRYSHNLKGTATASRYHSTPFSEPITNVTASLFDLAGASIATAIVPRINGVLRQDVAVSGAPGSVSFINTPLYIGRRAGTSFPFNGNLFSLIVRFGTNLDAGTITSTETWVNGKTGVTL